MNPTACNGRIEEISAQIDQLVDRRRSLQERRSSLDLPALKTDFLNEILTNLKGVVEAVPNAQKKHLLQLLLEKVLIKDQCTFEVWYRLPQFPGVRTLGRMVPLMSQCANPRSGLRECPKAHAVFRVSASSAPCGQAPRGVSGVRVRLARQSVTTGRQVEHIPQCSALGCTDDNQKARSRRSMLEVDRRVDSRAHCR